MINVNVPIIFVDVLGPLITNDNTFRMRRGDKITLDPMACDRLQQIVDLTGAHVVVSSLLCKDHNTVVDVIKFFFEHNYNIPFIGATKPAQDSWRENEIADWLRNHYVIHDCFVVLDDEYVDLSCIDDHLVDIDRKKGISSENVETAVKLIEKFRPSLDEVKDLNSMKRLRLFREKYRR